MSDQNNKGTVFAKGVYDSLPEEKVGYTTKCFLVDSIEDFTEHGVTPLKYEHRPPHYHVWVVCRKILTKQRGSLLYTLYATMNDARLYSVREIFTNNNTGE